MTDSPQRPEWIDLALSDDPRDVIHRAVACLARGGIVGLATETDYGLVAGALHPDAAGRLIRWEREHGSEAPEPAVLLLKGAGEVGDWAPDLSPLGYRLASRIWPGPAVLDVPTSNGRGLADRLPAGVCTPPGSGGSLCLCVPDKPHVREILRFASGPLLFSAAPRVGPAAAPAESLKGRSDVDMVIDDGLPLVEKAATVLRVEGDRWQVLREGAVDAATLTRYAGRIYLFVCTGNTCRSPMAEAIFKVLLAEQLGCGIEELEARGHVVLSAGVAARDGMPAASNAVEVVHSRGGSLQRHSSRQLTEDLVRRADLILTMTNEHLDALLDVFPEAEPRARVLDPQGGDVDDPVGADRETYRRTAQEIEDYLRDLLEASGD